LSANGSRVRDVDARGDRASPDEAHEVDAGAAAHIEHAPAGVPVEVDKREQVVQFVEVVLVEIREETGRARRVRRDLQVVDAMVPIRPDLGGHRRRGPVWHGRLL
jgi:hypothetical protein